MLRLPLAVPEATVRAKRRPRLPIVLTQAEGWHVLGTLRSAPAAVGLLLYSAGLRLNEALQLRVKDVDLGRGEVLARAGKGGKERRTVLPESAHRCCVPQLVRHPG